MHHLTSTWLSTRGVWLCVALALTIQLTRSSPTQRSQPVLFHHLTKRAFADQQCKGVYDKSIYARLDRICEDCYNLFREPELHSLCKKQCFTTDYFKACLDSLQLQDEMEKVQTWIKQLHGAEPGFRSQCFSTKYFTGCLEALLLSEETEKYIQMIDYLKGK